MAYSETQEPTNFVAIEMANGKKMIAKLDEAAAPITVANFKKLVSEKFYNGILFHRVIAGFVIQGGDPTGTGTGGSKETIKGEFLSNGVNNPLKHTRGVLSMARSMMPNSATSQFFVCHADARSLDGEYAAFGKLVEGYDVLDEIAGVPTDRMDRPMQRQRMRRVYFVEEV